MSRRALAPVPIQNCPQGIRVPTPNSVTNNVTAYEPAGVSPGSHPELPAGHTRPDPENAPPMVDDGRYEFAADEQLRTAALH